MNDAVNNIPWDFAFMGSITIDRAATSIWPHFFGKKKGFWTGTDYITVEGEPDAVGEVYVMKRPSHASHGATMYYEAIRIEAPRYLALKISYSEPGGTHRMLLGYDIVSLEEVSGRTVVTLHQVFSRLVAADADLAADTRRQEEFLPRILATLKSLAESEA